MLCDVESVGRRGKGPQLSSHVGLRTYLSSMHIIQNITHGKGLIILIIFIWTSDQLYRKPCHLERQQQQRENLHRD